MKFGEIDKNSKIKSLESVWAYALLGWLLGTFPPVALFIFVNLTQETGQNPKDENLFGLFFVIILICSVVGLVGGAIVGLIMKFARSVHWLVPLVIAPFLGAGWAIFTGGAGGLPVYVFGALAGMIYAAPVGILGFSIFAIIYELFNRRRNFSNWQIILSVFGVSTFILSGFIIWLAATKN